MPRTLLFCDFDLQFQGHWWPLKGQIMPIFSHFGAVLIYRKLDRPMAGIYNTYICHSGDSDSRESAIPLEEILIRVSTSGDCDPLFKGCNRYFH